MPPSDESNAVCASESRAARQQRYEEEKQVGYAQAIATRLNISISVPADVLASKALMIRWIDDHKKKKA